jgi:hypothetical protein
MGEDEQDYYRARQEQELRAAACAASACARDIHLELARLCGLRSDAAACAGTPRRVVPIARARLALRFAAIGEEAL